MRAVLQESQQEYQKLYDICVKECEKQVKLTEMWKKEKRIREEREMQLIELGEDQQMYKNQITHLEEQLQLVRESKDEDEQLIKTTVIEQ